MGKITVSLIRRRAEHNEGDIQSLEEISLHQEKLEKIELLDKVCRNLRILLLQNNSIAKIENVNRMKHLEYLNLAMNLVERIENLEGCESLKKLDFTLNFIGEISSVEVLKPHYFLEQLFLVGNPCHDFPGYRAYIITVLPQLKQLDGVDITKSERLAARQNFEEIEAIVLLHQEAYLKQRKKSKKILAKKTSKTDTEIDSNETKNDEESVKKRPKSSKSGKNSKQKQKEENDNDNDKDKEKPEANVEVQEDDGFWSQVTENTPEARLEMNQRLEKQEAEKAAAAAANKKSPLSKQKLPRRVETEDGRPLNVNEPQLSFVLHDEYERNQIVLDLAVPRFLCTTLIDADVQTTYVRVTVKGKIFQLLLPEEVRPDSSYAQRSQTTGHLIVTMPKVHEHSVLVWRGGSGPVIELKKPGSAHSKPSKEGSLEGEKSHTAKSDKVEKSSKSKKTGDTIVNGNPPAITLEKMSPKAILQKTKTSNSSLRLGLTTPLAGALVLKSKGPSHASPTPKKKPTTAGNGNYSAKFVSPPVTTVVKARTGPAESHASAISYSNRKMTSSQLFAWNMNDVPPLI